MKTTFSAPFDWMQEITVEIGLGSEFAMLDRVKVTDVIQAELPAADIEVSALDLVETSVRVLGADGQAYSDLGRARQVRQRVRELLGELWVDAGIARYEQKHGKWTPRKTP